MRKRGPRWELVPSPLPCRCGTLVWTMRNLRSGEYLIAGGSKYHRTPIGEPCSAWRQQKQRERLRRLNGRL